MWRSGLHTCESLRFALLRYLSSVTLSVTTAVGVVRRMRYTPLPTGRVALSLPSHTTVYVPAGAAVFTSSRTR